MRRKFAITLIALLVVSLGANVTLLGWLKSQKQRADMLDSELQRAGKRWFWSQAERDFHAGVPVYYATGLLDIGGMENLRANKPGRVVISLGCKAYAFDSIFVQAYNERMDALFAARSEPQIPKP